jgi:hypothetical protein
MLYRSLMFSSPGRIDMDLDNGVETGVRVRDPVQERVDRLDRAHPPDFSPPSAGVSRSGRSRSGCEPSRPT